MTFSTPSSLEFLDSSQFLSLSPTPTIFVLLLQITLLFRNSSDMQRSRGNFTATAHTLGI